MQRKHSWNQSLIQDLISHKAKRVGDHCIQRGTSTQDLSEFIIFQKFHKDILGEVNYFETDGTDSMNSDKDDAFIEDAIKENAVSDNTVEQESDDAKQSPTAIST